MFSNQKRFFTTLLAVLFAILLCTFAFKAKAEKAKSMTVSGCLQTGDEAGEYYLNAEGGKVYGLTSSSVKLGDHVGHKVTVTGTAKAEKDEDEDEAKENKEKSEKKEAGDIQVKSLKMVSTSCQ